ncbi:MAG: orotidine 5'-phosphate decarboxylase, partial [Actinomycetota bacterium]|nr:orotidine 5'-phosphate decarboxylase [Actinomycetota bacterium]
MAEAGTADSTTTGLGETGPGLAPDLRDRMALALDVDDLVEANRLARQLRPWFGVAKVGLELFTAAGPDAINAMLDLGYDVFLDLKLHDIPTTVRKSAGVAGALGVTYLTMHASGGPAML